MKRFDAQGNNCSDGIYCLYAEALLIEEELKRHTNYAEELRETLLELRKINSEYTLVCRELDELKKGPV